MHASMHVPLAVWAGKGSVVVWEERSGCEQRRGTMAFNSTDRLLPCVLPRLQDQGLQYLPDNRFSGKLLSLKETEDFRSIVQYET